MRRRSATTSLTLGANESGDVFVIDPALQEVRRFDSEGTFQDLVVKPGEGPGEMRLRPLTFGLRSGVLWWWELQTGRVTYVPLDGSAPRTDDTGLSYARFGTLGLRVAPITDDNAYWVEAAVVDSTDTTLRPFYRFQHHLSQDSTVRVLEEYRARRAFLLFDGGGTTVAYPGPPDQPIVFLLGQRLLRIDRPSVASDSFAVAKVRLMSHSGTVMRARDVWVPSARLSPSELDTIESRILFRAAHGGRRQLDRATRSIVETFVAEIPDRMPAFGEIALGPAGSVWLSQLGRPGEALGKWLVLDSLFQPVAQALVPSNLISMAYRDDQSWWATLLGNDDVRYVARLRFEPAPAEN